MAIEIFQISYERGHRKVKVKNHPGPIFGNYSCPMQTRWLPKKIC